MNAEAWATVVSVIVLLFIGLLLIFLLILMRIKAIQRKEINYRIFFILGMVFIPIGIIWIVLTSLVDNLFVLGIPCLLIGVAFLAAGLTNRDKWRNVK